MQLMSTMKRSALGNGVFFTYVPAEQFKTSVLSVSFLTPMSKDTASENSLLCPVLKRGSKKYPDMQQISAALSDLYGGELLSATRRFGESHCFGLLTQVTADALTLDHAAVAAQSLELLLELFLHPLLENGAFCADYVESEKANLLDKIKGELNEKRSYANNQLLRAMCKDEPYGVNRLGELERVQAITPKALYEHYQTLLRTARIEIFYCGKTSAQELEASIQKLLVLPEAREVTALEAPVIAAPPAQTQIVRERLDVAQGKLCMGFRATYEDTASMMLANGMFGGSVTSKLFMHVREELSLCYYASSQYDHKKQVILVSSGVEFSNFETARKAILQQLDLLCTGGFDETELEGARKALIGALRSYADSQPSLEHFWLGQAIAGDDRSPDDLADALLHVTAQQVQDAARAIKLDTIYYLDGKEA